MTDRVLVVEDDALMAETLSDALAEQGYDVVGPAGRLEDATNLAREGALSVAVLDYDLHGHPVIPLAWSLHEAGTPVIVFTGVDRIVIERTLPDGIRCVPKRGGLAPLLKAVRTACDQGAAGGRPA